MVYFHAEWHETCQQVKELLEETAKLQPKVKYAWIDADQATMAPVLEQFGVQSVPSLGIFHPGREDTDFLVDPEVEEIVREMDKLQQKYADLFEEEKQKAFRDIETLLKSHAMFVFMKGE